MELKDAFFSVQLAMVSQPIFAFKWIDPEGGYTAANLHGQNCPRDLHTDFLCKQWTDLSTLLIPLLLDSLAPATTSYSKHVSNPFFQVRKLKGMLSIYFWGFQTPNTIKSGQFTSILPAWSQIHRSPSYSPHSLLPLRGSAALQRETQHPCAPISLLPCPYYNQQ